MWDARTTEFEAFHILGQDALFAHMRIDRYTLPRGMFAYDIRHGDNGDQTTLKRHVPANYYGTVIVNRPVALGRRGVREVGWDDYGFREEDTLSLGDFMRTHPP